MNCIVHGVSESQTTTEWLSLSLYNDKINIKKHKTHMPSRLCLLYNLCQQICVAIMGSACMHAKSLQSCLTLCNPLDYNLPGSSVHGILQARILEWGAILFSRRSSQPGHWTWVSCTVGRFFTFRATRKAPPNTLLLDNEELLKGSWEWFRESHYSVF